MVPWLKRVVVDIKQIMSDIAISPSHLRNHISVMKLETCLLYLKAMQITLVKPPVFTRL